MSAPRVSFVSLGCPKALVDSERIITRLRAEGYEIARKHDGADLVVVNTCGFLDSARDESLRAIGDRLSRRRARGDPRKAPERVRHHRAAGLRERHGRGASGRTPGA